MDITKFAVKEIPGLYLIPDFITKDEEQTLLTYINSCKWQKGPGSREVQQFGYKYNYANKNAVMEKIDKMPPQFDFVLDKLMDSKAFTEKPDQCIVNKYLPGQGISAHTDHIKHFGPRIASLTIGSDTTMQFQKGDVKYNVRLEKQSLVLLTGEARYNWTHCIHERKADLIDGVVVPRSVRISLTFRNMILNHS